MSAAIAEDQYPDKAIHALPGYMAASHGAVFYWHHCPQPHLTRNMVLVVCPPLGHEYTHSHRTLKYMADKLAAEGIAVFRFDYHGVGDSPGPELVGDKLTIWKSEVEAMVEKARSEYPHSKVALIGLRFGATLAYLAAEKCAVDFLLLWAPVVKGRQYVREITALSRLSMEVDSAPTSYIETAGFLLPTETVDSIKSIQLFKHRPIVDGEVLIIGRERDTVDPRLLEAFNDARVPVTQSEQVGYDKMMDEPHYTEIPDATIRFISEWLHGRSSVVKPSSPAPAEQDSVVIELTEGGSITERCYWYDTAKALFGVLAQPEGKRESVSDYALVFVNSGSVHHVGPNRLYVHLSRALSAVGVSCLRLDLEGIGDSCALDAENKNHPYQKHAVENVLTAIDSIKRNGIAQKVVVVGVCSGAHTAFHVALSGHSKTEDACEVVMINPLTFYWTDDMSLEIPSGYQVVKDTMQYSKSVKSIESWKKLLTGKVSLTYLARFMLKLLAGKFKRAVSSVGEVAFGIRSRLANDLLSIQASGIKATFVFSSTDPGLGIVRSEANRVFFKSLQSGAIDLKVIEGADHTFSKLAWRQELYRWFVDKYASL